MKFNKQKNIIDITKPVEIKTYLSIGLLGKNYALNINFKNINLPEINIGKVEINIDLPKRYEKYNKVEVISMVVDKMYEDIAEQEIEQSMETARVILGFAPDNYEFKKMKNSYIKVNSNKTISINPEIVKYSRKVIDSSMISAFCKLRYRENSNLYKETIKFAMREYESFNIDDNYLLKIS
jgi:predicted metal-dependent hydrolase